MAENNVKKMYEYFSTHKNNKGNAFFGGTYDEFKESLADNNVRLNMYNHLLQANIFKGSMDEFDNELGFAQPHQVEQGQPGLQYVGNQEKGFGQRAKDAVWGGTLKLGAGIIDAFTRLGALGAKNNENTYNLNPETRNQVEGVHSATIESLSKGEGFGQKYLGTEADKISEENQQRYGYNEDGSAKDGSDLWREGKIGLAFEKWAMNGLASAPTTLVALAGPTGLVALGAGSAEQKYEQLKAEQPQMSEGAMITNAVLTGAFESATEYIGKLPILRNWKLFKDPATEEVLREQIERLGQDWVKKYVEGTLKSLSIQMGQEAFEEATNAIASMALDRVTGVDRGYSIDEVIDAAMAGAMGGATGGSALSGAGMAVGAYRQNKGRKAMAAYNEQHNEFLQATGSLYNQWEASLDESVDRTALRQTLGSLATQYANGDISRADLRAELINMGVKPSQMPTENELLGLLALEQDKADNGAGWFNGNHKSKEVKLLAYINGYYGAGAQNEILGFMRQNNLSQEQFVDVMTNNRPTAQQKELRDKFYQFMEGHREANQLRYKFLNKFCEENGVTEDQLDIMLQRRAQGIELKDWELELSNRFDEALSNYEHENKIKAEIDGKAQIAVDLVRRQTNNSNGRLQNVKVGNEEAVSVIKQGNVSILQNKEGKLYIDEQNSDDVVVVTDANGENARQVGIKELTPIFDGSVREVQGMAIESIERSIRNADTYIQGNIIALPNGQAGIVQSLGEDGSIAAIDFQGTPFTIAPQDTENARKVIFTEGMNVGGATIEAVQEDGSLVIGGEVYNPAEFASGMQQYLYGVAAPTPKAPIVTPQQAGEVAQTQVATQLEQDIADAKELGEDFVNTMLIQAQKALAKASKQKPTGTDANSYRASKNAIDAQIATAQAEVDRWLAVQQALSQEQIQNTINSERNETSKVENANQVGNVVRDKFVNSKRFEGNTSVRTLPNGTQIKGRYMLVSANSLTPSHNPLDNWNTSEGFPLNERGQNINDRDYKNDVSAQNETVRIAQQYGGQAVEQVPAVSPEGVVYDGNGRTMAGIIAAQKGTDASYTEVLKVNASNFGFTPQQVNEIPSARVVFVTDDVLPYTTQTFAQFNQQEKKTQSSTENAVAKSKSLDAQTISQLLSVVDSYTTLDSFFVSPIACADILKVLQEKGVIAPTEVAGLTETNKNGELVFNAHGREFITDVLIGANFTENVIRQMAGDKGLKQSVLRALNVIIANRKLGEFALTKHINNAISLIREANIAKLSVSLYLRQTNMFEALATERYTAFEILMAEQLQSGVENFRELLSKYNNYARENQGGQTDMFAEGGLLTIEDIINIILEQYGHRTTQTEHAIQGSTRGESRANEERTRRGDERGITERTEQGNTERLVSQLEEQFGKFNDENAAKWAKALFDIYQWNTLEEADATLRQLFGSFGKKLDGQITGILPFLDEAQNLIERKLLGLKDGETKDDFFDRLQKAKRPILKRIQEWQDKVGVPVEVIISPTTIKNKIAFREIVKGTNVKGWYDPNTGKAYIYLPNAEDVKDVDETVMHEIIAHKGLRELLGKEKFDELCDAVWDMMSEAKRAEMLGYLDSTGSHRNASQQERQRFAADEYIAFLAESVQLKEDLTVWESVVRKIKDILKSLGIKFRMSDEQLGELLRESARMFRDNARNASQNTEQDNVSSQFRIKIPKQEYAVLREAVMKNNTLYGHTDFIETAFTANNFYVYENYGNDSFNVIKKIKIEGNEDIITLYNDLLKDGNYRNTKEFSAIAAKFRRAQRQRNRNRNNVEGQRGTDAGLVSVDLRQQANPRTNNEESNSNEREIEDVKFRVVSEDHIKNKLGVDKLETEKVYRAMQMVDGKLYPPMAGKVNGEWQDEIKLGEWEEAIERPDMVDEKGKFKLDKGNEKSLKARYNPYFHTSRTPLNDQFAEAQTRPNLVTVEVEVPKAELTSGYKAEKAKDAVGLLKWNAGVIQRKLSGKREVILSRWNKPIRVVPDSEVAQRIVEMFDGKDITMPSNVVTPSLRAELEKLGIPFVNTDNQGNPVSDEVNFRIAYHGSGAKFDKFDRFAQRSGLMPRRFGVNGIYVSDSEEVGKNYALANRYRGEGKSHLYEVEIPDDKGWNYIHWESKKWKSLLREVNKELEWEGYRAIDKSEIHSNYRPNDEGVVYEVLRRKFGYDKDLLTNFLRKMGVIGISYPSSYEEKNVDENARSYVIFDENDVEIKDVVSFRITPEMEEIKTKAIANGTFMLAPNGQPTNLNEKQWLQVRTNAFKKWFGDWEKTFIIEKLRNSEPISVEFNGEYELNRDGAKQWMKDNLRGEYVNKDTGEKISLSNIGVNKVMSHGERELPHLKSIISIPDMIKNAIFIEEQQNVKNNDKYDSYQYYVCGLKIDNEDYTARIIIGVKGDNKYYNHYLTEIEKGTLIDNLNRQSNSVVENQNTLSEYKDTKLISILQTNSSKILDANGEPKVVWRGDKPNSFIMNNPQGVYFASNSIAKAYAGDEGEVYSTFLNIKNPAIFTDSDNFNRLKSEISDMMYDFYEQIGDVGLEDDIRWKTLCEAYIKFRNSKGSSVRDFYEFLPSVSKNTDNETLLEIMNKSLQDFYQFSYEQADYRDLDILNPFVQALGYDGVIRVYDKNSGYKEYEYITFNSTQIKSATDNIGTFDSNNPDIRFRITPREDKAYMDAVERGDMETAQRMVDEVAERTGYNSSNNYQGSIAFNGSAPSKNGYYETKEERKEAWDNGEFEGEMSLGDFVDSNIDTHDIEWMLNNPRAIMNEPYATVESIRNLRNTVRGGKRTIKMYRAIDADIKENSFRNGDWITPSRAYAKEHISLNSWKRGRIIEQEVSIDDIWWNGDDINEWGYDDGNNYGYQNTKNNRKLLDAVTYDDNGNVIPLSKRFNKRVDDIRFRFIGEIGAANLDKAEAMSGETIEDIDDFIQQLKSNASKIPTIELNEYNWENEIITPIGVVKMGENQMEKLIDKKRESQFGMMIETLKRPDIILEEMDEINEFHERKTSYLFVKTFKREDGSNYLYFESVTISRDGFEVSVSSHIIRENQLKSKLKNDRLLYKATALENPTKSSADKQPIKGGSLSSQDKGTNNIPNTQEFDEKNDKVSFRVSSNDIQYDVYDKLYEIIFDKPKGVNTPLSVYQEGTTEDGEKYVIRLSNHPADMGNFDAKNPDAKYILSIVVRDEFDGSRRHEPITNKDKGIYQIVMPTHGLEMDDIDFDWIKRSIDRFKRTGDGSYAALLTKDDRDDHSVQFRIQSELQKPIFVSNAQLALDKIKQEKATPQQWLAMLEKNAGIKAGEDKWLGLSDWLKENKSKSLTKQEIAEYIAENSIVIEEVWYNPEEDQSTEIANKIIPNFDSAFSIRRSGDEVTVFIEDYPNAISIYNQIFNDDLEVDENEEYYTIIVSDITDKLYDSQEFREHLHKNPAQTIRTKHTTQGLDNKQEVALTVPTIESWNQSDEIHFGDAGDGRAVAWVRFGETYDADGNRVLVIDEIQSKRHQDGREKGYQRKKRPIGQIAG